MNSSRWIVTTRGMGNRADAATEGPQQPSDHSARRPRMRRHHSRPLTHSLFIVTPVCRIYSTGAVCRSLRVHALSLFVAAHNADDHVRRPRSIAADRCHVQCLNTCLLARGPSAAANAASVRCTLTVTPSPHTRRRPQGIPYPTHRRPQRMVSQTDDHIKLS